MISKTKNIKMKSLIIFLILLLAGIIIYRSSMSDRDYANILLEKTKARLAAESGINAFASEISLALEKKIDLNSVFRAILESGWLQAGTEKETRFRITYIRAQEKDEASSSRLYNILCEGKNGAHVYSSSAVLEIENKACSIKNIRTKNEN